MSITSIGGPFLPSPTNDYEIIEGKPHLGEWFGQSGIIEKPSRDEEDFRQRPDILQLQDRLLRGMRELIDEIPDLHSRHIQLIMRPPLKINSITSVNGSVGIKFMVWGRAFKVKKLLKKGKRRYKKKLINGHRKYVRIDVKGFNFGPNPGD